MNKSLKMQFGAALKSDNSLLNGNPDLLRQTQAISKGSFPQGIAQRLGGGDLSKWRLWELAGLAFPATMPAVATARATGYALSKLADARTRAKVEALKQAVAKQGALPITPGASPWRTRALIGTLGNGTQGQ